MDDASVVEIMKHLFLLCTTGERSDLVAECQRYRKEREAALEEVNYLRKELQKSRREGSLNRSLERGNFVVIFWRLSYIIPM